MTANGTNRARSHNSVSLSVEGAEQVPDHDARHGRLVEEVEEQGWMMTRTRILVETGVPADEFDELLSVLASERYGAHDTDAADERSLLNSGRDFAAGGIDERN